MNCNVCGAKLGELEDPNICNLCADKEATNNPLESLYQGLKNNPVPTPPQTSELDKELLPCPFCGNVPQLYEGKDYVVNHYPYCMVGVSRNNCNHWIVGNREIKLWQNQTAAKRLKEVEKENLNLKDSYECACKTEQLHMQDLSTLRTEYKNALDVLYRIAHESTVTCVSSEDNNNCAILAKKILSTPHAIAAMKKGEV